MESDLIFQDVNATITIPNGQPDPLRASGTVYRYTDTINRYPSKLVNDSNVTLLTTMLDFTLFSGLNQSLAQKIVIEFDHPDTFNDTDDTELNVTCVYWNTSELFWSQDGCIKSSASLSNHTICECDHLTNFGLLFGGGQHQQDDDRDENKNELSQILTGFSIACLIVTQVVLHLGK